MHRILEGGNWARVRFSYPYNDTATAIGYSGLCGASLPDLEGLPDRWIKIVEGRAKWGYGMFYKILLDESAAHCIKEGLWKW